jgi:heme/copper-type cytochrome/quinol oxidase subunit 2
MRFETMKKKITKIITILTLAIAGSLLMAQNLALAVDCSTCSGNSGLTTQQAIECGSSCASGNGQSSSKAETNVNNTINSIVNILSAVVGVIAVIMIIIAGFRFVTSAGNPESAKAARSTIMYAVIGLVVVALAQVIVRFVLTNTATDCTNGKTSTGQACTP